MLNIINLKVNNKIQDLLLNKKIAQDTYQTRHVPPATKEWFNSTYTYNKNTPKLLPVADNFIIKLIKSYFNLYSRKLERKLYGGEIYSVEIKQSNLISLLYCLNLNTLLNNIFNYIFNKLYYILIYKVKSYLISIIEDIILDIYNKYFKVFILRFIKLAYDMFSIFYTNKIVYSLIYLSLFIGLTSLFYIYKPELCNMYIIYNLLNIYVSYILLLIYISLLIYINCMHNDFENKYPFTYRLLNIICILGILSCIFSISLSLYSILEVIYHISRGILDKLLHYIYKMMVLPPQKPGGYDGNQGGNHGPAPAGGGGKPPGKGPNGNPNKGGTDKPDVPISEEEKEEESDLSMENNDKIAKSHGTRVKFTGGFKAQDGMEQWEKDDISRENKRIANKKYKSSAKYKETMRNYRKSEKGKEIMKQTQERYQNSEQGKKVRAEYSKSEKGKEVIAKYNKSEKRKKGRAEYRNSEKGKISQRLINQRYYAKKKLEKEKEKENKDNKKDKKDEKK